MSLYPHKTSSWLVSDEFVPSHRGTNDSNVSQSAFDKIGKMIQQKAADVDVQFVSPNLVSEYPRSLQMPHFVRLNLLPTQTDFYDFLSPD